MVMEAKRIFRHVSPKFRFQSLKILVKILVLDGKSKPKPGLKKFILQKIKTSLYKHFKY